VHGPGPVSQQEAGVVLVVLTAVVLLLGVFPSPLLALVQ
jgi:hypothetical protein